MNTLHHNTAVPSDGHLLTRSEQPELLLERGYTGHEHLPQFGLINMNARLYEPLTARFLSPDPEVQAPDFSQNLNRYSYCLNNPFRYIDPTGEIVYETNDPDEIQRLLDWFEVAGYTQPLDVVTNYIFNRDGWNTYDSGDEMFTLLFSSASSSYYYSGSGSVSGMNILPEITVNGWRTIIPKSDFPNGDDYYNNLYHSDLWNGFTSATITHLEKYFKGNGWSYIIMNSKNELTPKIYTKRFYGNQYVKPTKFSTVAEKTGHYFAYISAISSAYDCYNSYTTEEYTVRTIDFVFSLLGCIPNQYTRAVSTAWSLGGKDLFWISLKGQRDMFIEQEKLGIIGLPAVQAFK